MNIINAKDIQQPHLTVLIYGNAGHGKNYIARQPQRPNADC